MKEISSRSMSSLSLHRKDKPSTTEARTRYFQQKEERHSDEPILVPEERSVIIDQDRQGFFYLEAFLFSLDEAHSCFSSQSLRNSLAIGLSPKATPDFHNRQSPIAGG